MQVALWYQAIDEGTSKQRVAKAAKEELDTKPKKAEAPKVKALHLKINQSEPYISCHQFKTIFSLTSEVFTLNIKLCLVQDAKLLTNMIVKAKALSLQSLQ